MNGRLENIEKQVRRSSEGGLHAELRYLLDRVPDRDRIIGALAPEQWRSIRSRVPPGHKQERLVVSRMARLAEELREEACEETAAGGLAAGD